MSDTTEVTAEIVESESEAAFTPAVLQAVRDYYAAQRVEYLARVAEIETFLGFAESTADLGTRLERLERHVGVKA